MAPSSRVARTRVPMSAPSTSVGHLIGSSSQNISFLIDLDVWPLPAALLNEDAELLTVGDEHAVLALHSGFFMDSTMSTIEELRRLDSRSAAERVPDVLRTFEETRRALVLSKGGPGRQTPAVRLPCTGGRCRRIMAEPV